MSSKTKKGEKEDENDKNLGILRVQKEYHFYYLSDCFWV
jgi:hypothetical protein